MVGYRYWNTNLIEPIRGDNLAYRGYDLQLKVTQQEEMIRIDSTVKKGDCGEAIWDPTIPVAQYILQSPSVLNPRVTNAVSFMTWN